MKKNILLLLLLAAPLLHADNYYWVGGTGNWNNYVAHWAVSSGGQLFHDHVPTPNDTVIFDSLSFQQPNDTVYGDSAIMYCYNMKWENVQFHPTFINTTFGSNSILKIYGSFALDTGMEWMFNGELAFEGLHPGNTITTAGNDLASLHFYGDTSATWHLTDSLTCGYFRIANGTFYSDGNFIQSYYLLFDHGIRSAMYLDTSHIVLNDLAFLMNPAVLDADSTTILYTGETFSGGDFTYNIIDFPVDVSVYGFNHIHEADFHKNCSFFSNNSIGRFYLLSPGTYVSLGSGVSLDITDTLAVSGSCSGVNALFGTGNASIHSDTTIWVDEMVIDGVSISGAGNFSATNCFFHGTTSGWNAVTTLLSRELYWVNGSGNWNDTAHWSLASGGIGGQCAPTPADNVHIDALSGISNADTIYSYLPNNFVHDLDWSVNSGSLFQFNTLHTYGSFQLANGMTYVNDIITFRSDSSEVVDPAGQTLNSLLFVGNGSWSCTSAITANTVNVYNGSFYTNGFNFDVGSFNFSGNTLGCSNSYFNCSSCHFSSGVIASAPSLVDTRIFTDETSSYFPIVRFQSGGSLSANSSFGTVIFNGEASVNGNSTFDSLQFFTLGGEIVMGAGSQQQVNDQLLITSSCDAPVMLRSSVEGTSAGFSGNTTNISISDIIMEDISASGAAAFTAFNSVAIANVTGWNVIPPPAGPLYWVGGTGNWNDPNHWSNTSGGAPGSCIPNPLNDVYFDANSFVNPSDTVFVNVAYAYCRNMDWTGSSGTPLMVDIGTQDVLHCFGSFIIDTNVTMTHSTIIFRSVLPGNTVNTNNQTVGEAWFDGLGGGWDLTGDMGAGALILSKGILRTHGYTLTTNQLSSGGCARALLLDSSRVYANYFGIADDTSGIIDADSAYITINGPSFAGGQNNKYDHVIFTDDVQVDGVDTIHFARFMKTAAFSTSMIFDTLFLDNAGYDLSFATGSSITLNNTMITSAQSSAMIGLETSDGSGICNLVKTSDTLCAEFLVLRGMNATGGAVFYAGTYSSDAGNNSGWTYQDCAPQMIDVWPGDANRDLITNNLDLLAIGIAYGYNVNPRANASIAYTAQPNWIRGILFANGNDIVNADCDGDGVIGYSDTTAVLQNYGITHPARTTGSDSAQTIGYPLYFTVPAYLPSPGDTVSIGIMLGNSTTPVYNVYGIAFTMHYDPGTITPNSEWLSFENSWLAPQGYEIHLLKAFYSTSTIEMAISRIDHQNISGAGEIARFHFTIDPNATGVFKCWMTDITLIDHSEITYPVSGTLGEFMFALDVQQLAQSGFHAYPNPTDGNYFIDDSKFAGVNSTVVITDLAGRTLRSFIADGSSVIKVGLDEFPSGTYFVSVENENGKFTERVIRR